MRLVDGDARMSGRESGVDLNEQFARNVIGRVQQLVRRLGRGRPGEKRRQCDTDEKKALHGILVLKECMIRLENSGHLAFV